MVAWHESAEIPSTLAWTKVGDLLLEDVIVIMDNQKFPDWSDTQSASVSEYQDLLWKIEKQTKPQWETYANCGVMGCVGDSGELSVSCDTSDQVQGVMIKLRH
jgi:hypothetical protein